MNTEETIKVLHVDDDKDDLFLFKKRISELDNALIIDWAYSAEEALEIVTNVEYDCILSDHELPGGMNGLEFLVKLREGGIDTPFIYLTGQGSEQIAADVFRLSACDYYSKEYSFAYFHGIANSIRQNVKRHRDKLERKRAEETLKGFHNERELLLSNINEVIWSFEIEDLDKGLGRIIYVSPAVEKITGYSLEEVLSEKWLAIKRVHPDDIPEVMRAIQIWSKGFAYTIEMRMFKKDGSEIWIHTNTVPVKDGSGKVVRFQGVTSDVTLRKMAELSLESGEAKYKLIFNSVPQVITIASLEEGILREVNDTFLMITGFSREEVIGKTVFELGIWVDPEEQRQLVKELAVKGSIRGIKTKLRHTNGQIVDATLDALLVSFENERCVMMITQLSTEGDKAMEDFRRSEERFRFLFNNLSDPLMVLDDKLTVIDINHPATILLGYNRFDLYGINLSDLVATEEQADLKQEFLKKMGSHNAESVLHFKRFDGTIFKGKVQYSVFHSGEKFFVQALISKEEADTGFAIETVDSQSILLTADEELVNLFRGFAETSTDMIYIKNLQGIYLFINDTFAELVGKSKNEIVGKEGLDFLSIDRAQRSNRHTEKVLAALKPVRYLESFSDGSEQRIFSIIETPIKTGSGIISFTAGIGRDITDLYKQEEQIRKINAELDEFVHKVSHDLRAPLRNISGYIEMANEKEGEERQTLLKKAISQSNKLQSFISRLLELSKVGRIVGNFQDFDSEALIKEVYDLFKNQYSDVDLRIDSKLPAIFGDRRSLIQVLQNIVLNALDHLDRSKSNAFVSISVEEKSDEVIFAVRDNGVGMKKTVLNKIFAPLSLIERKGIDTHGFGLSICRRIIEAHKGRIWAESVEGEGSTFYFSLPVHNSKSE